MAQSWCRTMSDHWAVFEDAALAQGFTQIPNAVTRNAKLSMQAKFMYGLLLSYAWQDADCFPGLERMRGDTGCKVDTLRKYIYELKDAGLIDVQPRGKGRTNRYIFKALTSSQDNPQRGMSKPPPTGVVKTTPNGGYNEYSVDKDSVDNPTGGEQSSKPVAVENRTQSQTLTDDFYRRLLDKHKVRLEKEEYSYHLGSFRNMLNKDEPTEEEINRVLAHMVKVFPTAPKIRATKALQDVRLKRDTGEAWSGPAPWEGKNEPLNPASDEAMAKRDKPNAPSWYATFYPVSISVAESMLKEHDTHSAMLDVLERRGAASA